MDREQEDRTSAPEAGDAAAAADVASRYLEFDEFEDVRNSLLMVRDALEKAIEQPVYWKWAIVAAHSALQGACVAILTQTDGLGALGTKSSAKTSVKLYGEIGGKRKLYDPTVPWPDVFLAPLPVLLSRLPEDLRPELESVKEEVKLTGDLAKLHDFRNGFSHFKSTSWFIELAGLPRILSCTISLTQGIATSDRYQRRNRFAELNLDVVFDEIRTRLEHHSQELSGRFGSN